MSNSFQFKKEVREVLMKAYIADLKSRIKKGFSRRKAERKNGTKVI